MNRVFKHQYWQMLGVKLTNMSNFHPLEFVGRVSETQLQVGEILFISKPRNVISDRITKHCQWIFSGIVKCRICLRAEKFVWDTSAVQRQTAVTACF